MQGKSMTCDAATGGYSADIINTIFGECTSCGPSPDGLYAATTPNNCPSYEPLVYRVINGGCKKCGSCSDRTWTGLPRYYTGGACPTDIDTQCTVTFTTKGGGGTSDDTDMPYEPGFMRVAGAYTPNRVNGVDTPARYVECVGPLLGEGMELLPADQVTLTELQDEQCVASAAGCPYDCITGYIARCKAQHYAVMSSDQRPKLLQCKPCPPNSVAEYPSLATSCQCNRGFANRKDIEAAAKKSERDWDTFSSNTNYSQHSMDKVCYNCRNEVFLNDPDKGSASTGGLQLTAISCLYTPGPTLKASIELPGNGQFVTLDGQVLQCVAGKYPNPQRTGFLDCTDGHKCSGYVNAPVECDGRTTFSSGTGNSECTLKQSDASKCPAKQMLVPNEFNNKDNKCEDCPLQGCGSAYALFAVGHNASNQCEYITKDNVARTYFACWPPPGSQNFDTKYSMAEEPGNRLVYNQGPGHENQPSASLEPCSRVLLPPHAEWVAQPGSAVGGSGGRQCYFACLYGVGVSGAAELRKRTRAHVYADRSDLIPFLALLEGDADSADSGRIEGRSFQRATLWAAYGHKAAQSELGEYDGWLVHGGLRTEANTTGQTAAAWRSNTFLMVDAVLEQFLNTSSRGRYNRGFAETPICLSPAQAYVGRCPRGFYRPDNQVPPNCAWEARSALFRVDSAWNPPPPNSDRGFAVLQPSGEVMCWTENAAAAAGNLTNRSSSAAAGESALSLSRFTPMCSECTQSLQRPINAYFFNNEYTIRTGAGGDNELVAMGYVNRWLWGHQWFIFQSTYKRYNFNVNNGYFNPYSFTTPGSCDFTCARHTELNVWRLDVHVASGNRTFSACVPCDQGESDPICKAAFVGGGYFGGCPEGVSNPTFDMVCQSCQKFADARLITKSSAANSHYMDWKTKDDHRTVGAWNDIKCRYSCGIGFTSNRDADAYPTRPCLPCSDAVFRELPCVCASDPDKCTTSRAILPARDNRDVCGETDDGGPRSYLTFAPQCQPCSAFSPQFDDNFRDIIMAHIVYKGLSRTWEAYGSPSQCLARCNISDRFLTRLVDSQNGGLTFAWVEQLHIKTCEPCSDHPTMVCGSTCIEGQFMYRDSTNTTLCRACNASACQTAAEYRAGCPAGSEEDAPCVDCEPQWLQNGVLQLNALTADLQPADARQQLRLAVLATDRKITRRWVFPAPGSAVVAVPMARAGQCYVACINNHVPIDLRTGRFFNSSSGRPEDLACIPCQSDYIVRGAGGTYDTSGAPIRFYSMWNASADGILTLDPWKPAQGSALASMAGRVGACYTCSVGFDTADNGTVMCEQKQGFGMNGGNKPGGAIMSDDNSLKGGGNYTVNTPQSLNLTTAPPAEDQTLTNVLCCRNNGMVDICQNLTARTAIYRMSQGLNWTCAKLGAAVPTASTTSTVVIISTTPAANAGAAATNSTASTAAAASTTAAATNSTSPTAAAASTTAAATNSTSPTAAAASTTAAATNSTNPTAAATATNATISTTPAAATISTSSTSTAATNSTTPIAASTSPPANGTQRRRLLQLPAAASQSGNGGVLVKVMTQPLTRGDERQHFVCCSDMATNADELAMCQALAMRQNEFSKLLLYDQFQDYCRSRDMQVPLRQGRRLLQQQSDEEEGDYCYTGQYKPFRGMGRCLNCPDGASTGSPWNGITSANYCACLPGFRAVRDDQRRLIRCVPCGAGFYRAPGMPEERCQPCDEGMQTPVGMEASGACYCSPGTYMQPSGGCALCEAGYFCNGLAREECPPNSASARGARARGDCACNPGWVGALDTPGQLCFVPPPGLVCVNGSGVVASTTSGGCNCAPGWTPKYRRDPVTDALFKFCTFGCELGQYMLFDAQTFESQGCRPCPKNTFSSSRQMLHEPSKPDSQQCTPCPPNYQTLGVGANTADACICFGALQEDSPPPKKCGACGPNTYMQPNKTSVCLPCPDGLHSPPGSVGIVSCVCPAGRIAFYTPALECRPCPTGTYSPSGGATCSSCPDGLTTAAEGATSVSQCVCPPGLRRFLNSCR